MPLAGKGMLLTSMDIDPSDEAEFNRWYDREHLEERVAIDGFLEARRYVAHQGSPKYLSLYSTETFDVLDSPAYRNALANQTDWSRTNIARFKNMIRAVARITISRGQGRGAALGLIRLRPSGGGDWFVLIDGTHINATSAAIEARFAGSAFEGGIKVSTGSYNLMWDLVKNDPLS